MLLGYFFCRNYTFSGNSPLALNSSILSNSNIFVYSNHLRFLTVYLFLDESIEEEWHQLKTHERGVCEIERAVNEPNEPSPEVVQQG